MINIDLNLDAIMYRKVEIVAASEGMTVCDYLNNFFGREVSTPDTASISEARDSFCR